MFGEVWGNGVKDPMTHPKDMNSCLTLSSHTILQICSTVRKREFITSFGEGYDWVDPQSLFL